MDIVESFLIIMCWAALLFVAFFSIPAFIVGVKTKWGVSEEKSLYSNVSVSTVNYPEQNSQEIVAVQKETFYIHLLQPALEENRQRRKSA